MKQHGVLSGRGNDGPLLPTFSAALGQLQPPAPQVTIRPERAQNVLCPDTTYLNGTTTANTDCQTTSTPGQPAYTSHTYIQQEYVHALMPDGQHVTLWCQSGFASALT
jgi:hypothetical protein